MILTLAQMPHWIVSLLTVFFLLVCLAMILIILIQRPQGGGLSGAFGAGGGSGQTAFGAKTGDVLTIVTIAIFVIFLCTAVGLNFAVRPPDEGKAPTVQATTPQKSERDAAKQKELQKMGGGDNTAPDAGETGGDTPTPPTPPAGTPPTEPEPQTPPPADPPATGDG